MITPDNGMTFNLIIAACFIVGFASQFFLLLKVKKTLPRLCPSIFVLVAGIYSALRMFGIISYPGDGRGFFDAGALVGIVRYLSRRLPPDAWRARSYTLSSAP